MALIKKQIKDYASKLGFIACGISDLNPLLDDFIHWKEWIKIGYEADMHYMSKYSDIRQQPTLLLENAKTVISLLLPYYPGEVRFKSNYHIAKYALGDDYHDVMKSKLFDLLGYIKTLFANVNARCFVDTAPIFEKSIAQRAGIGWIGKNTCLIHPQYGSYCFIGEIILDVALSHEEPMDNKCGSCKRCVESCPTGALEEPYLLNANKCISYLTIEHREMLPQWLKDKIGNKIYGCDICQDVCPWNKSISKTSEIKFQPRETIIQKSDCDWEQLSKEEYLTTFKKSPVKRIKYEGILRNIRFVNDKSRK